MLPDEPNEEERLEELPEDNGTPFQAADPQLDDSARTSDGGAQTQRLDDTHPDTDTEVQPEDAYENGIADASEASEPNAGSAVLSYKGVPNPMVDDDADIDVPKEMISKEDEDNQTAMEEV